MALLDERSIRFLKSNDTRWVITIWTGLVLFQIILLVFSWSKLPSEVPLFYSRPWGDDQLAPKLALGIFPLGSLVCLLINGFFARLLFGRETLLSTVISWSVVLMTLLSTIGLFKIILLVS